MKILITGSEGFIGKNLCLFLSEKEDYELLKLNRETSSEKVSQYVLECEIIIHLAGVNRPEKESDFEEMNTNLTKRIIDLLIDNNKKTPILFSSSIQAELNNLYGKSKKMAEDILYQYGKSTGAPVSILRLPGVFGKFCKPYYNSVIATFCYNIARGLEIEISDKNKEIRLVYIDTVIEKILNFIESPMLSSSIDTNSPINIEPIYKVTLGEIEKLLLSFSNSRSDLKMENVGNGFLRTLYSTFISYLPNTLWSYEIPKYSDTRGVFVEMLKTKDSGQFSYFTALPGVTRGEHYHQTKTEKFLVIKGIALFRFRNKISNEYYEFSVSGENPTIVDTIPGWAHDITNIGSEEMIVMLWANEVFDRTNPDTYSSIVIK